MSMTTELAQRMKAAAIRAKAATEDYVADRMSITTCLSECEEFNNLSDGPDNTIALVEALEARDKQIVELKKYEGPAKEYVELMAYMDGGGDFYEFQSLKIREACGE